MMKHNLEELLAYGRNALSSSTNSQIYHSNGLDELDQKVRLNQAVNIGGSRIEIAVDYKVILMSQYVSKKVIELAGRPLEIGYIYGGSVNKNINGNYTQIKIDDFYTPVQQKISHVNFQTSHESVSAAQSYFSEHKKRIVGIGHSHADFDVFHSNVDLENYKRLSMSIGIKINHPQPITLPIEKSYFSASSRLKKIFSFVRAQQVPISTSYVLPSIVFNANGNFVDSKIAVRSPYQEKKQTNRTSKNETEYKTHFDVLDCNLRIYNKQATLTLDDKMMLDHRIRQILAYNRV